MAHYTTADLRQQLRAGAYAWPGGYPVFFVMADGEPVSFDAVQDNYALIIRNMRDAENAAIGVAGADRDWCVIGCEVNWEDPHLYCAHTGKRIESAYAEDDAADRALTAAEDAAEDRRCEEL